MRQPFPLKEAARGESKNMEVCTGGRERRANLRQSWMNLFLKGKAKMVCYGKNK